MSVAQSRLDAMATTTSTRSDALDVLRTLVGRDDARFHDGQFEAIDGLVADHRRALVVQALRALYPRFDDFTALRDRLDPHRAFRNPYLDRVLGG